MRWCPSWVSEDSVSAPHGHLCLIVYSTYTRFGMVFDIICFYIKTRTFSLFLGRKSLLTQKSGIQTDPDLRWFYFSASRQCKSDIHLVETALQILNFDLFFKACVIWHNPLFWCGAAAVGWGSQSAA